MEYVFEMPEKMLRECAKQGNVERFAYDTFTYDEGDSKPLHKGAWVYLPAGYDSSRKYNILYLLQRRQGHRLCRPERRHGKDAAGMPAAEEGCKL